MLVWRVLAVGLLFGILMIIATVRLPISGLKSDYSVGAMHLSGTSDLAKVVPAPSAKKAASDYLSEVMDRFHKTFDVYTDSHAAGNHFVMRGRMSSPGDEEAIPSMDEASTDNPRSGINSIKASFKAMGLNWGGWYFMNGVLQGAETCPIENWGDYPSAGIDLRGATKLTFWARGAKGGESVQFFAFGIGWNPDTGSRIKPYPDSSPKVSSGYVTLSTEWKQYTIDLSGQDLSYVLGGFGWVTNASQNKNQDITFYLDDIRYDKERLSEPRFLVSYETISSTHDFDMVMRNVAFTYDNAVALLAFLASGDKQRAKLLADALVYAQQHDRFWEDGRLRNAYQGGDIALPPGWTPNGKIATVRMPGWYDATKPRCWAEDSFQVSTHTGNVGWGMLALLAYYQTAGESEYLTAAERMGEWIELNFRDTQGSGGYTGGVEGWEPAPSKLLYKATEHNIDLYAAFQRLYLITGDEKWRSRANYAKQFVLAMWDQADAKFWTGTKDYGVTINKDVIPLDIQAWAVLTLKDEGTPYWRALDYVEAHHKVGNGFDFNQDRDGVWYEGTAQMAVAYQLTGQQAKAQALIAALEAAQQESGGVPAADKDGLTTGFSQSDGQPWLYFRRLHVGATAWLVLAEHATNPFWAGAVPTLVGPTQGAFLTSLGTTLSWANPPGTTQYHLQVTPANNDGPAINLIRNAEASYVVQPPIFGQGNYVMLPGMTYSWRVRATSKSTFAPEGDPSWGPWSDWRTFRTPAPSSATIGLVYPANGSTLASVAPVALQWANTTTDIFYYEVQVSPDPNFGELGAVASVWHNLVHGGVTTPANSWMTPELLPRTTYYWRVRPRVQGDGTPVAWSDTWSFKTP